MINWLLVNSQFTLLIVWALPLWPESSFVEDKHRADCRQVNFIQRRLIEMNEATRRFLLISVFTVTDDSSNYVVIVTSVSLWAIRASVCGFLQPAFMQIGSTLCSPVTAWHISSPNSPGLREDFQTMFGLWVCLVFCMSKQHPQIQSCMFVCMGFLSFVG